MYDELMDELREILEERGADIEALANEIETEEGLQTYVARIDTILASAVSQAETLRDEIEA